jgi:sarcosine oxidase
MDIGIVGTGVMGLSTALACHQRGHKVTLYDQHPPLHTQGSSHGNSRIVRLDYPDPFYLEIMLQGYPLWKNINLLLQKPIFTESGIVTFGDPKTPDLQTLEQGLISNKIPYDRLDHTQTIFPALRLTENEIAIHNPVAGWANADLFRQSSTDFLLTHGHQRIQTHLPDPTLFKKDHDALILTLGAWSKQHLNLPVTINCQTFAYLRVPNPAEHTKVWIESSEHGIYGFPPESSSTDLIKFGVHSPGPEVDPANPIRPVSEEKIDLLRQFAQSKFNITNPELINPQSCLYTNTATTDFLWGEYSPGIFWASPCSGHGFKFGPWIGERLTDFAESKLHPSAYPRFCASQ